MVAVTDYLLLIRNQARFLAFGFLMAFVSSAGQTYFIGIFGPGIRETFGLNHTQWGSIYLVGTLASALVLPWSGHLIDKVDLRFYTAAVVIGLAIACMTISVAPSVVILTISIFLLRHFGQGLSSHTSVTCMARYMATHRGKSIAIASMGYSTGEALLPFIAVMAIVSIGWRNSYQITALLVIAFLPILIWLLKGHSRRHQKHIDSETNDRRNNPELVKSKTRRQMLTEYRFYLLLPAILAPSYIGTGLFFHHLTLAEYKGWSAIWVTGNYWVYALCTVMTSLITGPLIDKYTAAKVLPLYLLPMTIALLLLIPAQNSLWVLPYMALFGVNTGIHFTGVSALWAEIYGTQYLGGIKSLVGAISVFASALGPVTIGLILDKGYSFDAVCIVFSVFCVVSTAFLIIGLKQFKNY